MENASKALIMAGGVFISLLVIGLLVFFFNNLSDLQRIEQSAEETQIAAEFNKQYDVYQRNVYGSELLSIANKINDYNKREANNKGYTPIVLLVTFNTTPDEEIFEKGKTYDSNELVKRIDEIDKKIEIYSSRKEEDHMIYTGNDGISKRTIAQLATMRTKDIKQFFDLEETEAIPKEITDKINAYNNIKNLLTQIKAKVFKYVDFDYDKYNGRIIEMKYKI